MPLYSFPQEDAGILALHSLETETTGKRSGKRFFSISLGSHHGWEKVHPPSGQRLERRGADALGFDPSLEPSFVWATIAPLNAGRYVLR